jgi:hypothetical protein
VILDHMTAAELLEETNTAISRCLSSQAYSIAEREQRMADLDALRKLRAELIQEVAESENGGQWSSVGQIDPPS